jgi:hypothetical protein
MQKTIPDHSPLLLIPVACHSCGKVLEPKVIMGRHSVSHIEYECRNEKTGCSYRIETNTYLQGEMKGVRMDGTVPKL